MILKRKIVEILLQNLNNDYVLIVLGARQTGKTSVLFVYLLLPLIFNCRSFFKNYDLPLDFLIFKRSNTPKQPTDPRIRFVYFS